MILSRQQAGRFIKLFDMLVWYANGRLGVGAKLPRPGSRNEPDEREQVKVTDVLWERPDVIDDFVAKNPFRLNLADRKAVAAWKGALHTQFVVVRDYDGDGTLYFLAGDLGFKVCGISREVYEMLTRVPCYVETALLPFDGRITYDLSIYEYPVGMTERMQDMLNEDFGRLRAEGRLVTSAREFARVVPEVRASIAAADEEHLAAEQRRASAEWLEVTEDDLIDGFHRGQLAGLSAEDRTAAQEQAAAELRITRLRDRKTKGQVQNGLAGLLASMKKDELSEVAAEIDLVGRSNLRKAELIEALMEELPADDYWIDDVIWALGSKGLRKVRTLCEHGGEFRVPRDDKEALEDAPHPYHPLVFVFEEGDDFVFVMPDELLREWNGLPWDNLIDAAEEREAIGLLAEIAVDLRAFVSVDELYDNYRELDLGICTYDELLMTLTDLSAEYDPLFRIANMGGILYVVSEELSDDIRGEMRAARTSASDMGARTIFMESLMRGWLYTSSLPASLKGLKALQDRHLPARTVTQDMIDAGGYLTWAGARPEVQGLIRFCDAYVPDGKSDLTFAEEVAATLAICVQQDQQPTEYLHWLLDNFDLEFGEEMLEKFFTVVMNAANGLPRWTNNGWSPSECHARRSQDE